MNIAEQFKGSDFSIYIETKISLIIQITSLTQRQSLSNTILSNALELNGSSVFLQKMIGIVFPMKTMDEIYELICVYIDKLDIKANKHHIFILFSAFAFEDVSDRSLKHASESQ